MHLPRFLLLLGTVLLMHAASCKETDSASSSTPQAVVKTDDDAPAVPAEPVDTGAAATTPAVVEAPATLPAIEDIPPETILVKLGNAENITQGDFERAAAGFPPRGYPGVLERLIADRLFLLYLKDHPHLATDEDVERLIDSSMRRGQTRQDLEREIAKRGWTIGFVRERNRISIGLSVLKREANLKVESEAFRNQFYEENRGAFDGTEVFIRCVAVPLRYNDTPEVRDAKRRKIEDIRQRLIAGQIDWKKALEESNNPSVAAAGGDMGWKTRYGIEEAIAKPAFELKPGEMSPVFEAQNSLMFIMVRERRDGNRPPDDRHTIQAMKVYLEQKMIKDAHDEAYEKYTPEKLRPPARTPLMASKEIGNLAPPPADVTPAATRPTARLGT